MNEENLSNVLYCSATNVFSFQDTIEETRISYIIIVLPNTEYSFLWKNELLAQFCAVDVVRSCAIKF